MRVPNGKRQRVGTRTLAEVADQCGVPCVASIPIGHIDDQWTLPLGRMAVLDADAKTLTI